MGASMFDYYCLFYWAVESPPDLIIIPINWRTFGEGWLKNKQYFHPELSALAPIFRKQSPGRIDPIKSRGISAIKQAEYKLSLYSVYFIGIRGWARASLKVMVDRLAGGKKARPGNPGIPDDDETRKDDADQARAPKSIEAIGGKGDKSVRASGGAEFLARHFRMEIEESNPVLLALGALADLASDHDTKVLFYVWPIDYEYLAELGILDTEAFEHSMSLIADIAKGKNIHLVDLSGLLEHKYFFDKIGHCRIAGRKMIAETLAPTIREMLEEQSQETGSR